jgi:hypothetical protein
VEEEGTRTTEERRESGRKEKKVKERICGRKKEGRTNNLEK